MRRVLVSGVAVAAMAVAISPKTAVADTPQFGPPHGMILVEADGTNKLYSDSGVAGLSDPSHFFTNAQGNTVVAQNMGVLPTEPIVSIREDDGSGTGSGPTNPGVRPTITSPLVRTDDPGYYMNASFPANYVLQVNPHNALRYWDPSAMMWTSPAGGDADGERLRVYDPTGADESGGPAADLEATYTATSSGTLGTINIDKSTGISNVHGHLFYELTRGDGAAPNAGAYMIELALSAVDVSPGGTQPALTDSDPIFIIFNNGITDSQYSQAVSAAVPEPSTVALVGAIGSAFGLTRRRRRQR